MTPPNGGYFQLLDPARRIDVDVAGEDDRPRILALDERPDVGATAGQPFDVRLEAGGGELPGEELGARELVGVRLAGVDGDVLAQELHLGELQEVDAAPLSLERVDPAHLRRHRRMGEEQQTLDREAGGEEREVERRASAVANQALGGGRRGLSASENRL